jgi:glucosamine--fructose-6-phosphate aminotransferase (isomerizing)
LYSVSSCFIKRFVVFNIKINHFHRQRLEKNFEFQSQTDTETILALITNFAKGKSLNQIAQFLFNELKGAFAIAAILKDYDDVILGLKNKSPLIIGLGDGENYLSSDVYAIADKTNKFIFLEDGQFVILKKDSFEITNEFDGVEGGEYLQEVLKQAEGVPHMMTVPKGGARKANKAKKSRKSRKSRKARKSRKSRKARKTRKH